MKINPLNINLILILTTKEVLQMKVPVSQALTTPLPGKYSKLTITEVKLRM